ncbi:MAG TPA: S-methyl-5-thioribose-1-phosphate isomerase, partial [Oligoflexia bacterium]|nr:S-methyl-5-thioribose-1-phosphate isomerase [Oligoflexia bacterium]
MQVAGQHYQTIWLKPGENRIVQIIDQRFLPFRFTVEDLRTLADCVCAIKDMHVRGAPLIGACAAYGMYLAACEAKEHGPSAGWLAAAAADLKAARPTAVNLAWAVDRQLEKAGAGESLHAQIELLRAGAESIRELELENSRKIGEHGYPIIEELATRKRGQPVNILTHCNAGWLACIDYGTATAPI